MRILYSSPDGTTYQQLIFGAGVGVRSNGQQITSLMERLFPDLGGRFLLLRGPGQPGWESPARWATVVCPAGEDRAYREVLTWFRNEENGRPRVIAALEDSLASGALRALISLGLAGSDETVRGCGALDDGAQDQASVTLGILVNAASDRDALVRAVADQCEALPVPYLRLAAAPVDAPGTGPLPPWWDNLLQTGVPEQTQGDQSVDTQTFLFPKLLGNLSAFCYAVSVLSAGGRVLGLLGTCLPRGWSRYRKNLADTLSAALGRIGEDRRRIGLELHDDVGQRLVTLSLYAAAAGAKIKEKLGQSLPELDELSRLTEGLVRQVRDLSRGMVSADLGSFSLAQAVERLLVQTQAQTNVNCKWYSEIGEPPSRFPPGIELHLFRVIQESVKNTLTHSQAQNIAVRLQRNGPNLVLGYEDDGTGLPRDFSAGLGLRSIRYRAAQIGASVTWYPGKAGGFSLRLVMPGT